jgi:hypothetical protein
MSTAGCLREGKDSQAVASSRLSLQVFRLEKRLSEVTSRRLWCAKDVNCDSTLEKTSHVHNTVRLNCWIKVADSAEWIECRPNMSVVFREERFTSELSGAGRKREGLIERCYQPTVRDKD